MDANAAERWREHYTEDFIGEPTWQLAEQVGYSRPLVAAHNGKQRGVAPVAPARNGHPSRPAPRWSPLVAIETRGRKLPIFCIHDVNGTVYSFYQLARALGSDQPFYGLQAVGMNDEAAIRTEQVRTVEALAAHYVAAIRTVQPTGPYLLGGYSLGCQIALAMVHQLQAEGATVAHLLLLDGRPPNVAAGEGRLDSADWLLYRAYSTAWRQEKGQALGQAEFLALMDEPTLRPLPFAEQITHLNQRLNAAHWGMLATEELATDYALFQALSRLIYGAAAPISVPATFFYTQGHYDLRYPLTGEPALGWRAFLPTQLICQLVPGTHLSFLLPPYVNTVAQQVATQVQQQLTAERNPA